MSIKLTYTGGGGCNGGTALMMASEHGNEAAVKLLIEAKANIDSAD